MYQGDSVWSKKGGTLSDKFARKEFGLSQQDIVEAIVSTMPVGAGLDGR
jgi:hypothetical protein